MFTSFLEFQQKWPRPIKMPQMGQIPFTTLNTLSLCIELKPQFYDDPTQSINIASAHCEIPTFNQDSFATKFLMGRFKTSLFFY